MNIQTQSFLVLNDYTNKKTNAQVGRISSPGVRKPGKHKIHISMYITGNQFHPNGINKRIVVLEMKTK